MADMKARAYGGFSLLQEWGDTCAGGLSMRAVIAGVANTGREPLRMAAAVVALVTRTTACATDPIFIMEALLSG